MKFLENHQSTSRILSQWAVGTRLIKASFYFWNAGTRMQKSIEGLLQSLLYTIFLHQPNLIAVLCPNRITSTDRQTAAAWSLTELQAVFDKLILEQDRSTKFYFHIDGLDEYEGDPNEVIKVVEMLAQQSTYKVCVSSRPWNQFQKTFGRSMNRCLQLHLFTREDIECFARECLHTHRTEFECNGVELQYEELVSEISQRAQGVFLWVRLVVRSLRDGQFNSDPVSILRQRLDEIPTDLEQFFQQILRSVDPVYGERMARTFLTALASPEPLKIIHYSFLDEEDPYMGWTTEFEPISQEQINMRVSGTRWRLNGRYKGLLEPDSSQDSCHIRVDFLHRTLRDFLLSSRVKNYLEVRVSQDFDPEKAAVGTLLAEAKFLYENLRAQHFISSLDFLDRIAIAHRGTVLSDSDTSTSKPSMEFQIMDHIEAICRTMCSKTSKPQHSPGPILRAAVHYQQFDYVKHRLQSCPSLSELNWILLHLCCYPDGTRQRFANILSFNIERLSSCECISKAHQQRQKVEYQLFEELMAKKVNLKSTLQIDLISELLARGANPNAEVQGTVIWNTFLDDLDLQVTGPFLEDYLKILRLMLDHGVILDKHMSTWTRILEQIPHIPLSRLESILECFSSLLEHGLEVNTNLWLTFIFQIPAWHSLGRIEAFTTASLGKNRTLSELHKSTYILYRNLCRKFLRLGVNVTTVVDILPGYRFENMSWFDLFRNGLENNAVWAHSDGIYALFEVSFENGLDPNHGVRASTMWELFLQVLSPANCTFSTSSLMLLFLKHRADPNSETLHQILGLRAEYNCMFREPEASDLRSALQRELADLRWRDQLFESKPRISPYTHQSNTHNGNSSTTRGSQRKPLEKRNYSYNEQYVNRPYKRTRRT